MQKTSTKTLYDYWNVLRGGRSAPDRRDIDPTRIRTALANTFILELNDDNEFAFVLHHRGRVVRDDDGLAVRDQRLDVLMAGLRGIGLQRLERQRRHVARSDEFGAQRRIVR